MNIDLNIIYKEIQKIDTKLDTLVREKMRNKHEILEEEIIRRGWMDTKQVMAFFNCNRNYAIQLLEKVGRLPEFVYVKGDSAKQIRSKTIYKKSIAVKRAKRMEDLFSEKTFIYLKDVMDAYSVDIRQAKIIANEFVNLYPNYKIGRPSSNDANMILEGKEENQITITDLSKVDKNVC